MKLIVTVCWLACLCYVSAQRKKPNVILMLADDMGYDDLGFVNREVISPNIDKLAYEGVILNNNYVMNVCTPTRHCAMTGRYPFKTEMAHIVIFPLQGLCTPTDIKLLPQYMKEEGYNTYMAGKWHLGFCRKECLPTERGFDHLWGFYQGEQDFFTLTSGPGDIKGYDWRNGTEIDWSVQGTFNMYLLNDYIVKTIETYDDEKPFFMYLAFTAPHTPLESPEKFRQYYDGYQHKDRDSYLGLVTSLDSAIGNLTEALKRTGHYDNTLLIFSSDNGGEHGGNAHNGKLRGSKGSMFEGGIKALGFVHGPMLNKVGYRHDGLFHVTDWLPTIMGIIDADNFDAEANDIDGIDQSDMILNGGPSKRDDIVYNIDMRPMHTMGQAAVRKGAYKFLWGGYGATDGYDEFNNLTLFYAVDEFRAAAGLGPYEHPPEEELTSVGKRSAFDFSAQNKEDMEKILELWKFNAGSEQGGLTYLFNIEEDPYERNNLADHEDFQGKVREMKQFVLGQLRHYREARLEKIVNIAAGNPNNFNGTWSTGWCDNVDQRLDRSTPLGA